jgi:peptidyl-prolyl cis-trans isomerase D
VWTEKALQAVFSEDALKSKRNTAAIEVAANTLLAARVVEYKPATAQPLTEVAAGIRKNLEKQQAAELAAAAGQNQLEQLQRGEKVGVSWKAAQSTTRNQRAGVDPALLQAVFRASTDKLPAYVGVNGQSGFALARIDAIKDPASIDEAKRRGYAQQIRQITGEELLMSYLADAKKRADISMKDFSFEDKK